MYAPFLELIDLRWLHLVLYTAPMFVALILVLLYAFRWRDYSLPRMNAAEPVDNFTEDVSESEPVTNLPKLSVVITSDNQFDELVQHLPLYLAQDYPDFEIIVVNVSSCDATAEFIKHLQLQQKRLRHTFVPASATHISRKKFAITLGVRSARAPWVVVTHASARPASNQWLRIMASAMSATKDIVLGYANYPAPTDAHSRHAVFNRLFAQLRYYRSAQGFGAIGGDSSNFAFRKTAFLEQGGYDDNLQYNWGEADLLIQKLATRSNVGIAVDRQAILYEPLPIANVEANDKVFAYAALHKRGWRVRYYCFREAVATFGVYLLPLLFIAYIACRGLYFACTATYSIGEGCLDLLMLLFLILMCWFPLRQLKRTTDALDLVSFGIALWAYSLQRPFDHWRTRWGYFRMKRQA